MRKIAIFVFVLLISARAALAADLGSYGNTFTILEPDLLSSIESKLLAYEASGELAKFNEKYKEAVKKQVLRPNRVLGIEKASEDNFRKFDPTTILDEDIIIPEDNEEKSFKVLYTAGTKVNPLDYMTFLEPLVFIDGDDEAQIQFARETFDKNQATKIILINGEPGLKLDGEKEYYYYFDQWGAYSSRFGISKVPSIVYQSDEDSDLLTVEEVVAE